MADTIKVLAVRVGAYPRLETIPNTLDAMQEFVGGYIETITVPKSVIVCNEEGKLIPLPPNRVLCGEGMPRDVICGDFFICGVDDDEFCDIDRDECIKFTRKFRAPLTQTIRREESD